jgi:hypothetical protein
VLASDGRREPRGAAGVLKNISLDEERIMNAFLQEHFPWVVLAGVAIVIALVWTASVFWRARGVDRGFQKGQAAHPERVRQQNPPDHARK